MQDKSDYHHYIPRFLLRNFAIDNCERVFASSKKLLKKQPLLQKKKKPELIQTYDCNRANNKKLGVSLIGKTYGNYEMYKDFNHEDVMHVENKLADLERKASLVIRKILKESQIENEIILRRKELNNLRKFLFIMNYRNPTRWSQFTMNRFDSSTLPLIETFMQEQGLKHPREVWLQNIRGIIDTHHDEVKDNLKIFIVDRTDYRLRMFDCFLVIWQAGENDEFIITSNGFGIFEGVNGTLPSGLQFQFAYHWFYVISPKLALVLCHFSLREQIEPGLMQRSSGFRRSLFEYAPHPAAIPKYTKCEPSDNLNHATEIDFDTAFDLHLNSMGYKRQEDDTFTFPFVKITTATVHLVNSILLNETKPDLVLTFISRPFLYKTIVKYHKDEQVGVQHDFSNLKRTLFVALNKTHEEDLHLRKNILTSSTCNWNVSSPNPYK